MNPVVSDETLHAFVDNELDVAESECSSPGCVRMRNWRSVSVALRS